MLLQSAGPMALLPRRAIAILVIQDPLHFAIILDHPMSDGKELLAIAIFAICAYVCRRVVPRDLSRFIPLEVTPSCAHTCVALALSGDARLI